MAEQPMNGNQPITRAPSKKPANWTLPARYGDPEHPTDPGTGKAICACYKAKLNKYGDPVCLSPFLMTNKRCRIHGGETPRGIASPQYRGLGYSQDIPLRIRKRYEDALNDPNMLSMAGEIAIIRARIGELLSQLDSGESGSIWKTLRASVDGLEQARLEGAAARRAGDQEAQAKAEDALAQHLNDVVVTVKRGSAEYTRMRELYDAFERERRLIETMRKQRRDMQDFITSEQFILAVDTFANLVAQNVTDTAALRAISQGITRMMNAVKVDDGGT